MNRKPEALLDAGLAALKQRDAKKAESNFAEVLRIEPHNAAAALQMAKLESRAAKHEPAFQHFSQAEANFSAASDFEGVNETLFERAVALSRANRQEEALPLIARGEAGALSTGDTYHVVRLGFARAQALLRRGDIVASQQAAEAAVKIAFDNQMENAATVSLIDLGNASLLRSDYENARMRFEQALKIARRNSAQVNQARAALALASLSVQVHQPKDALRYIATALEFYRRANFRQELDQSLILTGSAHRDLMEVGEAEKTLREAVKAADALHDPDQSAVARLQLASVIDDRGNFPDAIQVLAQVIALGNSVRGGLRVLSARLHISALHCKIGDFVNAQSALSAAEESAARLPGKNDAIRTRIELGHGTLAYSLQEWTRALAYVQKAAKTNDPRLALEPASLAVLINVRLNRTYNREVGNSLMTKFTERNLALRGAGFQLDLAQALACVNRFKDARFLAAQALSVFAPLSIDECIWRCHAILASARPSESALAKKSLAKLQAAWPERSFRLYEAQSRERNQAMWHSL